MAASATDPRALEDRVVGLSLALTWPCYAIGGLYVLGPVLGVTLTGIYLLRAYLAPMLPGAQRPPGIPIGVWIWIAGMIVMLISLLVAHFANNLGTGQTIKSTIGWAKGWGLFAMFALAGACLRIKFETVIKGAAITGLISLLLTPALFMAPKVGLPEVLFVSPLKAVGGPGPEFFAVQLYSINPGDGTARWRYFTPWSPAAAYIGNLYLILALEDKRPVWRIIGVVSALAIIVLSASRLGLAAAMAVWPTAFGVSQLRRSVLWIFGSIPTFGMALFAQPILIKVNDTLDAVRGMRADSNRVREALGRIAVDRWRTEAPMWGHGVVENGPHYVEYMPIGSHHTWFGLLFIKGITGVFAFAIPLLWSLAEFTLLALSSPKGRAALAITLLMVLFTVGENLEMLIYLFWPGLVVMGMAMREAADRRTEEFSS